MAGLVPAIHVFVVRKATKAWMPATSAGMTAEIVAQYDQPDSSWRSQHDRQERSTPSYQIGQA
jgi:hypothetical protein